MVLGKSDVMKILALLLLVLGAGASSNAPADQYFGQLKVSALRIRYEIMQLRPRYETHKLLPEEAAHLLVLDENAFYAWASAYPKDAWLASTGYMMAQLFAELPGTDARDRAVRAFTYVKTHFPTTSYGKGSVAALHKGIAVQPDPAWAVAMRAERATPPPAATPAASETPSAVPASPASAAPASPASASPTPTASPARGKPGYEVRIARSACTISSRSAATRSQRERLHRSTVTSLV
jgi:hypothetical protein